MPDNTYKRAQVLGIINSVLGKIKVPEKNSFEVLTAELSELKTIIERLKSQLQETRAGDIGSTHIPTATDELDAVVVTTEEASKTIMDASEHIMAIVNASNDPETKKIENYVINIFEACSFQDITGQRIRKVIKCLKDIDVKTAKILEILDHQFGASASNSPDENESNVVNLLNGPQLPQNAVTQDDIDKLLAEFDEKKIGENIVVDDLIIEFLTETNENLSELDSSLLLLEKNPNDKELLSKIFRVMHTIKGTSGFLGLARLGSIAHKAEDLLGLFRDGKLQPNQQFISLILEAIDAIKKIVEGIEKLGQEEAGDDTSLISRLKDACQGKLDAPIQEILTETAHQLSEEEAYLERLFQETPVLINMPQAAATIEPPTAQSTPPEPPKKAAAPETLLPAGEAGANAITVQQSLRVNVDVLEDLMTLVSELVLSRNQIMQLARSRTDGEMSSSLQHLSHIVSDLQDGVMKTRMQPVGNAWSKLPRIVRDIANDLGKKIELEMLGQETELDRQVLEMIKDPLTHMVRNSADHGIEKPDQRITAGKPETGTIKLNSFHAGGYIIIEISDDGKGLPLEKIKSKILQNKLASEAEIEQMSSQQIQQYIFAAGFSTAEQVTSVSGRGVGMDVVRTNIEKIGGFIDMNSVEGEGTTFTIKIPLTLAIISSLIVGVDTQRYAIPQLDVSELVLIKNSNKNAIEYVNGSPIYRLRDNILPLICLRKLLGYPDQVDGKSRYIIVISSTSLSFGLIVDNVFDTEEIVVKPITSILGDQNIFSGNTILGDGAVIMILDSTGILRTSEISVKVTSVREPLESQENSNEKVTPLLLFNAGNTSLKAVPLEHVARLEDLDVTKIEIANGMPVIQYGNSLMPIYMCDPHARLPERGRKPIIVFRTKEGLSGLLVDRILDITSHRGEYQMKASGDLEGSAIVKGMATDILNLSFDRSSENYKSGFTSTQDSMSHAAISLILGGTSDEMKGEA